jgi:hypothetical protein
MSCPASWSVWIVMVLTPRPPTSVSTELDWSARYKGFSPCSARRSLQAAASSIVVALDRVIGDGADRGELVDHQADRRVMGLFIPQLERT